MPQITAANAVDDAMGARLEEIAAAHARLRAQAAGIGESAAREPIALPGWTRGHVLFHIGDLARAFARQADFALAGESVEVYDGGRPTRDRRIEEFHGRPVEWLRERLEDGLGALETVWSKLSAADWELACSYRDGSLTGTQLAWWRETELHSVDLLAGYRTERWSPALASHVVTFLQPRLVAGPAVRLLAIDTGEQWGVGEGEAVQARGTVAQLAGWISGRPAEVLPASEVVLPEPGAWP